MIQQFYPERPIRSSRRAVLREVALKNKRLAELSAENAELREMLVDQQSALDHIMIKYVLILICYFILMSICYFYLL